MTHCVSVLLPWQSACEKQLERKKGLSVIRGFWGPPWAGSMAFRPMARQKHHPVIAGLAKLLILEDVSGQGVPFKVTSPETYFHLPCSQLPIVTSAMTWWSHNWPYLSTPTLLLRSMSSIQRTLLQVCYLISTFLRLSLLFMFSFIGIELTLQDFCCLKCIAIYFMVQQMCDFGKCLFLAGRAAYYWV